MVETGCAFMLIALCCTVAVIVGGNVSLPGGAQFGNLSKGARVTLGLFASFAGVLGLILVLIGLAPAPTPTPPPDNSSVTQVTTPPDPELTWGDYVAETSAICRDLDSSQRSEVTWPDADAPYSDHAAAHRHNLNLLDGALSQLRLVAVPAEQHELVVSVWSQFQAIIEAEELIIGALDAEDYDGVAQAFTQVETAQADFNRGARSIGLSDCVFR